MTSSRISLHPLLSSVIKYGKYKGWEGQGASVLWVTASNQEVKNQGKVVWVLAFKTMQTSHHHNQSPSGKFIMHQLLTPGISPNREREDLIRTRAWPWTIYIKFSGGPSAERSLIHVQNHKRRITCHVPPHPVCHVMCACKGYQALYFLPRCSHGAACDRHSSFGRCLGSS